MGDVQRGIRTAVKAVTPPIVLQVVRNARTRLHPRTSGGAAMPSSYYDRVYRNKDAYKVDYPSSRYYFIWSIVADRLARENGHGILDLGCGPGQFAQLLRDRGIDEYVGVDFSEASIDIARRLAPFYEFKHADLTDPEALKRLETEYDTVVLLEVLEHLDEDLELLSRIRPGARVIFSVPDFDAVGHVRFFATEAEVEERYAPLFSELSVDRLRYGEKLTLFLGDGRI